MELNQERQLEAAKLLKQMVVTLQQNIEDNKLSQDEINSVIGDVLQLIVDNF
jgi:predicted XRE-type DNA-binding protein